MTDFLAIARQYEDAIISGEIPACRWTRLGVERARRDHARQLAEPDWPYCFNEAKAIRVCQFISELQHTKSSIATKAGERIVLLPFQVFILTELFGWTRRDTGARRWKKAFIEMGKGNAKSTLSSCVGLYSAFCEGEGGADVLCAASMKDQARIVLDGARQMCQRDPLLCQELGIKVQAHDIIQPVTQSRMRSLPAKASSVEGVSPSLAILDEVHAARGRELYDTLSTACAKRSSGLFLMVTTAGNDAACLGYELHQFIEQLLNQEVEADTFFAMLYGIDSTDAWDDPLAWQKANPAWRVSVDPVALAAEAKTAQAMPGAKKAFRVFHLSEWISNGSDDAFLDFNSVRACYDKELREEEFADQPAVLGLDLARRLDLCSMVRVHSRQQSGKPHFYVFAKNWLPQQTASNSPTPAVRTWVEQGHIISTPGAVTNYDEIEETIFQEWKKCKPRDLNYDPEQAAQIITHLRNRTEAYDSFIEITQFHRNMTSGMTLLEEIVADGRLHTNSPVLLWCLGNLRAQHGGLHFVWPVRPKDREQKIDAAVALVMALKSIAACPLDESESKSSPYARRGIIVLDHSTNEWEVVTWKCEAEGCAARIHSGKFCPEHGGASV